MLPDLFRPAESGPAWPGWRGRRDWSCRPGSCFPAPDPVAADAFRRALHPWADGANDQIISISPGMVTGFRLVTEGRAKALR